MENTQDRMVRIWGPHMVPPESARLLIDTSYEIDYEFKIHYKSLDLK